MSPTGGHIGRIVTFSVGGASPAEVAFHRLGPDPEGILVGVSPWGARLVAVNVADRHGRRRSVVVPPDLRSPPPERAADPYVNVTIGRYANRIGAASIVVDGRQHVLAANEGPNQLHGGPEGFDRRRWETVELAADRVTYALTSPDGDQGFPGAVEALCTYRVEGHDLWVELQATTDAPTVVSLTNHAYWNLRGGAAPVLDHRLLVAASHVLDVDDARIPTGNLQHVDDSPFDLRQTTRVRDAIARSPQGAGLDHCYVLDGPVVAPHRLRHAATLTHGRSGRILELFTDQPGLQVYTGNALDGSLVGFGDARVERHGAICLEAQDLPDAPNHAGFPSTVLRPGERYHRRILHRFSSC